MEEIIKLYNEHLATPFPDRRGDEILGIDLVLIDSDTSGLITNYIGSHGRLNGNDLRLLKQCHSELRIIVRELRGEDRQYFARLQNIAGQIIEKIEGKRNRREDAYKTEWRSTFLKIREILNEWDPIGVADSVDDEYDAMNFRMLSVLMNKRDKKKITKILADYTRNAMGIEVDLEKLDSVAERISSIKIE